jgi:hypothetical protein
MSFKSRGGWFRPKGRTEISQTHRGWLNAAVKGGNLPSRQAERGRHEADSASDGYDLGSVAQNVRRFRGQEFEAYHVLFFPMSSERLCNFGRSLIHCSEYDRSQVAERQTIVALKKRDNTLEQSHLTFLQNKHTGQQRQYTSEMATVKKKQSRSTSLEKDNNQ